MENAGILKGCAWRYLEKTIVSLMEDCSTLELMKREKIFCAFQYKRRVSRDYLQNRDYNEILQKQNKDINRIKVGLA